MLELGVQTSAAFKTPRPARRPWQPTPLEVENQTGGDAQIVPRLAAICRFREARQEIFDLSGPPGKTVREFYVDAAAERCRKRVVRAAHTEASAACVRNSEERLRKRSEAFMFAVRNARTEEIGRNRAVDSGAENVVGVIATEIGNGAEPVICVVGNGSAATVQVETVHTRCAGIVTDVGIPHENVELRRILRKRSRSRERKKSKQTHYHFRLHTTSMRILFAGTRARGATLRLRGLLQAGKQ